jgi:cyclic dehypoxanthinyl futalosine synthase
MGSIMIEENVISAAGAKHRANDTELRRVIEDAGFIARQRTTLYERYVN